MTIDDDPTVCPGCSKSPEGGFNYVIAQGKGGLNVIFCTRECGERFLKDLEPIAAKSYWKH